MNPLHMPAPGSLLNVLIVDDHDIVRIGVRHVLEARAQVFEATSLHEAQSFLARGRCDLLLLDLGLGDEFSLTTLPQLRAAHPALKIIVLTSMSEDLFAERALRAGADGFVMKSELARTLLQAIDTVLGGHVHVSPALGSVLLRRMSGRSAASKESADDQPDLSAREIEVLRLIAAGKSTRDIADALNRSVKTIETHKQSLKLKLGADSPAALVRLALSWCSHGA